MKRLSIIPLAVLAVAPVTSVIAQEQPLPVAPGDRVRVTAPDPCGLRKAVSTLEDPARACFRAVFSIFSSKNLTFRARMIGERFGRLVIDLGGAFERWQRHSAVPDAGVYGNCYGNRLTYPFGRINSWNGG